jgi:translocation and assembly module TamA
VAGLLAALALSGCASLKPEPKPAAAAQAPVEYRLSVEVEGDKSTLTRLLREHLDLARFQAQSGTLALGGIELQRLIAATPAQVQALLETEGHFAASSRIEQTGSDVRLIVTPGPVTRVTRWTLELAPDADPTPPGLLPEIGKAWPLPEGSAFTQNPWRSGKADLLLRARAAGFPLARWAETEANIDPEAHTAQLLLRLAPGPQAHLGALKIEGLVHQSEQTVRRLAGFEPGALYTEQRLQEFQDRLAKTQLFDAVRVQLLPEEGNAAAMPVLVSLREAPLQQATVAVGYHANTGQRLSLEHVHRHPFGLPLRSRAKLDLGRDVKGAELELSSHPLQDLQRNLAAVQFEQDRSGEQDLTNFGLRLGRLRETGPDERLTYAELLHARQTQGAVSNGSTAYSLNRQWTRRRLDNPLLPTDGYQGLLLVGGGWADGGASGDHGAFGRVRLKLGDYRPLGAHWYGSARLEVAQVLTRASVGVPEKLLFRAGGDDSVRGYGYNTLGPVQGGVVVGGRVLAAGSLEVARPFSLAMPSLWGALFVDAGQAASSWGTLRPVVGWGAGLRWRSPVGPLRVDLARAEETGKWRLHFSVGIAL